jgi:predicted GH43/DUF377 family glycosyl hydrolase
MTYTAFVPHEPRVAIAISSDLQSWQRLGVLHFDEIADGPELNACGNKDASLFPDVISDPEGVPSFGILHRPTTRLHFRRHGTGTHETRPPSGEETQENIWISYIPVDRVMADITSLTTVRRHEGVMAPQQPWETNKVGTGAPPVRLPYGWVLPYHAVSAPDGHPRYCMGVAILDLDRPRARSTGRRCRSSTRRRTTSTMDWSPMSCFRAQRTCALTERSTSITARPIMSSPQRA